MYQYPDVPPTLTYLGSRNKLQFHRCLIKTMLKKQAASDILSRFILNFDCVITWNLRSGLIINPLKFQLLKVY